MKLAKAFAEIDSEDKQPAETTIKGFMPIGSIDGSGSVAVTAYEIVVPSREIAFQGVRFEITSGDDYPSEGIASVALESAEKLLSSIEQLANAKVSTDRYALSEIETRVDDLRIVVFNTAQGRILAAIEAAGTTCHFFKQSELLNLHKLVGLAVNHLRSLAL